MSDEKVRKIQEIDELIKTRMGRVKHKIVVLSGKGGVGKSVITANLALALAWRGRPNLIGILDADITGPSIPKILNTRKQHLSVGLPGIFPAIGPLGIKIVSMDYLLPNDETPVIWRGPMKASAIRQFLAEIVWGELEYLLVDLPPGTGDEALTIAQSIPAIDGVIIVTIPSEVSQLVVKKAVSFCKMLNLPIIGIVENMSGFTCPKCGAEINIFMHGGGEKIAKDMGIEFIGKIPLDQRICESSDRGVPFIVEHSQTPTAKAFMNIVEKIEKFFNKIY
jgi:ATP-binding protein involved in chromosome partitioning